MRYHKDIDSSNFERHEIKTYQRKGDQVRSEYERLNPDGTVTKTVAYGDCKEGMKYRTYHMGLDGVVREIPQEVVQRMLNMQAGQVAPPQPQAPPPPPPPPAPLEKPARKAFAFMVEPKETHDGQSVWRVRPLQIKTKEPTPAPAPPPPPPPPPPQTASTKTLPWWYDTLKEAINESLKVEKPQISKPMPPPPEPEPKKMSSKRIFDFMDDDFFALKPFKSAPRPRIFDNLLGEFDKPLLDVFNTPLLDDF